MINTIAVLMPHATTQLDHIIARVYLGTQVMAYLAQVSEKPLKKEC